MKLDRWNLCKMEAVFTSWAFDSMLCRVKKTAKTKRMWQLMCNASTKCVHSTLTWGRQSDIATGLDFLCQYHYTVAPCCSYQKVKGRTLGTLKKEYFHSRGALDGKVVAGQGGSELHLQIQFVPRSKHIPPVVNKEFGLSRSQRIDVCHSLSLCLRLCPWYKEGTRAK
jgi:hypothetical protein